MYTITINHKNVGKTVYNVYKEEEAIAEEIPYTYWKKANKGEYAISDDGYVAKVINKKIYTHISGKDNVYLRFPWGYTFFAPDTKTKSLNVKGRKTNVTMSGKPYLEVHSKQQVMQSLAMLMAQTSSPDIAIKKVLGDLNKNQIRSWKRKMKSEVFKTMVREELHKLLKDHEMDEEFTLNLLKVAIDKAKQKGDITNLLKAVENLQDMHGMKEKYMVKTTQQIEGTSHTELLDDIEREEKHLLIKSTKVEPVKD